mmetsp:Transcript_8903/g.24139  ORF Transcript_8903/g.24139 Transcript_8903/m.24139 type:complete len:230 (-) Transcript_8903:63-752(-)
MRRVGIDVVLAALDNAPLAFVHAREHLVRHLGQGAELAGAEEVVDALPLLDHPRLARGPDGDPHLLALLRVLPAGALLEERLDRHAVPEEVVLRDPADELNLEDERGVCWHGRRTARTAVGKLRLHHELGDLPLPHRGDAQIPALDDLRFSDREDKRRLARPRGVKLTPVALEGAYVVHCDLVTLLWLLPVRGLSLLDNLLFDALGQVLGWLEAGVIGTHHFVIRHVGP